ncbi:MAG: hypothetical protein KKE62_01800 [Proteobacteria bacterium]|nr:hypothetical protein [Pseudomonadota bacterium]MBU1387128.1 hypothetical protein [Pseudomonadota bacterium]MBU1541555.1 hypothetical protein [Pseudomonadota bacterium]MBU2482775.1 hypothetical protein [Pseudomonadota bacterium]
MITIRTWDELLDAGVKTLTDELSQEDIIIGKNLTLKIRIKGDSWDGSIDYRGAQFVIDLQNTVIDIYKEVIETNIPLHDLKKLITVKVKVEEGSQFFTINIDEALKKIMEKVTGKQITLMVCLGIACATGSYNYTKTLELRHKEVVAAEEKNLSKEYIQSISSIYDRTLDMIDRKDIEAPIRKLVNKLDEEDKIQLPGADMMKAEAVKKMYPRRPKFQQENGIFDSSYTIAAINMEKTPIEFKLKKDDKEFWADAELSPTDIEYISKSLETAMKKKEDLKMDLHVFIIYDKHKIKSASIQATGSPRQDSQKFIELIAYWQKF